MPSRHLSLRLEEDAYERLDSQSRQTGQTRSHLARTLLDEGLRMAAHPGVVFRPGPAGRRPGLASGPDVWEVAQVFRQVDGQGEELVQKTAPLTGLSPEQVRVALRYYVKYKNDIDTWIDRVNEEAAQAEASWRREQGFTARETPTR